MGYNTPRTAVKKVVTTLHDNRSCFRSGMRDGIPIALGYFAVAFTLGIAARNAGFTALQAFVESLTNNASAGEYAVFSLVAAGAGLWEVAIMTLVANARYLLMSCSLSQKLSPDTPLRHRMLIAFDITDEIFGISIAVPGRLNPWYTYEAPSWNRNGRVVRYTGWLVDSGWFRGRTASEIQELYDIPGETFGYEQQADLGQSILRLTFDEEYRCQAVSLTAKENGV